MRLVYVPWMVMLLAGVVYALVITSTLALVIGLVLAACGAAGWADTARRYRATQQGRTSDHF